MSANRTKTQDEQWAQAWRVYLAAERRIKRIQRGWDLYGRRLGRKRLDAACVAHRAHVEQMIHTSVRWSREALGRYRSGRT